MASEYIDDTETGTGIYPTKIPGYEDAADIQEALKIYHYGTTTIPQTTGAVDSKSVAGHLLLLRQDLDTEIARGIGSQISNSAPLSPEHGYIWVDADTDVPGVATYSTAVYTNEAPTTGLTNGILWVDKDASPPKLYVYDSLLSDWVAVTEIPSLVDNAGDIIYGTGANTIEQLPIGTEGEILKVSSGIPSWSSDKQWVLSSSGNLSGQEINVDGLTGERIFVVLKDWSHDNTEDVMLTINFNDDNGPNYVNTGGNLSASSLHSPLFANNLSHDMTISVELSNTSASLKPVSTIADNTVGQYFGYYKNPASINSINLALEPTSNFDGGSYEVWSYK